MTSYADAPIEVGADHPLRLSADALRALKKATGQSLTDLTGEGADDIDRMQTLAFAELYRREAKRGHMPDAGALWERAGRVELDFVTPDRLDPTAGES